MKFRRVQRDRTGNYSAPAETSHLMDHRYGMTFDEIAARSGRAGARVAIDLVRLLEIGLAEVVADDNGQCERRLLAAQAAVWEE